MSDKPKPNKVILGIDPGSQKLGYAVLNSDGSPIKSPFGSGSVVYGLLQSASPKIENRALALFNEVLEIMFAFEPDTIAIEAVYRGQYRSNDRAFGVIHSVIWCALGMIKKFEPAGKKPPREIRWVQPGQMRAALGVKKSGTKADMAEKLSKIYNMDILAIQKAFGLEPTDYDVSDAIAVAHACSVGKMQIRRIVPSLQRDIIFKEGQTLEGFLRERTNAG